MTHKPIIAMAVVAIAATTPVIAAAQQPETIVTAPESDLRFARVSYGDLNLTMPAGQRRLHKRVGNAAARICKDDQPAVADLAFNACRANAVRGAAPQVAAAIDRAMQGRFAESAALAQIIVR